MMRVSPRQYATALVTVLDTTPAADRPKAIRAFLQLLQKRRHLKLLPRIVTAFEADRDRATHTIRVTARAARPLAAAIETQLRTRLGASAVIEEQVDPRLKGGLRLVIGQTLIDGTVGTLIADLRRTLSNDSFSSQV